MLLVVLLSIILTFTLCGVGGSIILTFTLCRVGGSINYYFDFHVVC